jgi:hypothetical protein
LFFNIPKRSLRAIAFTGVFFSIIRKKAFLKVTSAYFSKEKSNPKKIKTTNAIFESPLLKLTKLG